MQPQLMPNMREVAIENKLFELWRTLPLRGVTDHNGVLGDYLFALRDCSVTAIENTVDALRAGLIDDASKEFCPKAPKLAEYAREEHKRLEFLSRPKTVSYQPVEHQFKDYRIIHRQMADELAAKGWVKLAEGVDITGARNIRRPGSTWFWSTGEVWSPPA